MLLARLSIAPEQGLGGYIYFKCFIPYLLRLRKLNLYVLRLTPPGIRLPPLGLHDCSR